MTKYYISLTTIPSRFEKLDKIINSLLEQNIKPYKIIINIPFEYKRFENNFSIPNFDKYDNIIINRCSDYGSATKFIPLLKIEEINDDDKIIILDDDICYNNITSSVLLELSEKYPNCATCIFGVTNAKYFIDKSWIVHENTQKIYPAGFRGEVEGFIDVFEGFGAVCLKKKFFTNDIYDIPCEEIYFADDIWLSGHIIKNGFKIVVSDKKISNNFIQDNVDGLKNDIQKYHREYITTKILQDKYNIYL